MIKYFNIGSKKEIEIYETYFSNLNGLLFHASLAPRESDMIRIGGIILDKFKKGLLPYQRIIAGEGYIVKCCLSESGVYKNRWIRSIKFMENSDRGDYDQMLKLGTKDYYSLGT